MRNLVVMVIALALFLSCAKNPFSSRDSEEPFSQAGTFIPPTSPEIVLENLRLVYSEQVIGNFIQTIDSSFVFRFDYIEGFALDSAWDFVEEINLTENLFNDFRVDKRLLKLHVELTPRDGQVDVILDTSATLIRGYVLTITDSLGVVLDEYQGVSQFEMVESSFNYWSLLIWEDLHLDTGTRSWADLKNKYR